MKSQIGKSKKGVSTVFVLTRAINEYNQQGEYFVDVFASKPHHMQLTALDVPRNRLRHVLNGGGRIGSEYEWFYLREQLVTAVIVTSKKGELNSANLPPIS